MVFIKSSPSDSNEQPESGTTDLEDPRRDRWTLAWSVRLGVDCKQVTHHLLSKLEHFLYVRGGAINHYARAASINQTVSDKLDCMSP